MSGYTRQRLVPVGGPASRKRKEREEAAAAAADLRSQPAKAEPSSAQPAPAGGNRLLAGYLAHEFLTRGTLLGKQLDRPAARFGPGKAAAGPDQPGEPAAAAAAAGRAYEDVSYLLRMDGAHIPGIVNPTQLGQWLQM